MEHYVHLLHPCDVKYVHCLFFSCFQKGWIFFCLEKGCIFLYFYSVIRPPSWPRPPAPPATTSWGGGTGRTSQLPTTRPSPAPSTRPRPSRLTPRFIFLQHSQNLKMHTATKALNNLRILFSFMHSHTFKKYYHYPP